MWRPPGYKLHNFLIFLIFFYQSLLFFLAGYDTIATTTGYVLYALAKHPEVQARLQEEIDDSIPEGKLIEYDTVFKMEYLDKVWQETLRMYPAAFV